MRHGLHLMIGLSTLMLISGSILLAQQDQESKRDQDSKQNQKVQKQPQAEMRRDQQPQQQDQRNPQLRVSPSGWVRVGVDYDNDGYFDALETIYLYDLEVARQKSLQRGRSGEAQQSRTQQRPDQGIKQRQQWYTVHGKIKELRQEDLSGLKDSCMLARIQQSKDGRTARVCLGPKGQISKLNLQEGDKVTVQGTKGHINKRPMLFARKLESDGQQISISMHKAHDRSLKRMQAEIRNTRTAKFRGFDEPHIVAEVSLRSGQKEMVNLGPKSKVDQLDLEQGDQIFLMARQGRINGEPAMIAERIRFQDKTIQLPRPQDSEKFRKPPRRQPPQRSRNQGQKEEQGRVTYQGAEQAMLGLVLSDSPQRGVEIENIRPNSPAAKAKLKEGDQILAINDDKVRTYRDVASALEKAKKGKQLDIRIRRQGQDSPKTVQFTARPSNRTRR